MQALDALFRLVSLGHWSNRQLESTRRKGMTLCRLDSGCNGRMDRVVAVGRRFPSRFDPHREPQGDMLSRRPSVVACGESATTRALRPGIPARRIESGFDNFHRPALSQNPYRPPESSLEKDPVRVKVYGLFRVTRPAYVAMQLICLVAACLVILACYTVWPPERRPDNWFMQNLPLLMAAAVVLELGETFFVLRRFADRERSGGE